MLITGRGNGSEDGVAKIKPEIIELLWKSSVDVVAPMKDVQRSCFELSRRMCWTTMHFLTILLLLNLEAPVFCDFAVASYLDLDCSPPNIHIRRSQLWTPLEPWLARMFDEV